MNVPNRLTLFRMILVPFIVLFMLPIPGVPVWNAFIATKAAKIIALVLFCLASLSDFLDGQIARRKKLITNMGKFLDPIADKLLVITVLVAFVELNRISTYVVLIVLAREFAVTGLRLLAVEQNVVIAASYWGKAKTLSQMIAIIWLLLEPVIFVDFANYAVFQFIGTVLIIISTALALISGIDYLVKNRKFLTEH
ncbi:MAG: CDP-diacylglycerol--glycerol-3-phosphate 3-phosphatidyltransferase [Clostridiaceae bacterium]|nr:CDP-diacylglycerol--glycerol-3-phosphate 3-phosphatidyltransferase [Clostridiaceae bacterium]